MIIIKTKPEIDKMKEAGKIVREALQTAGEHVAPGITTSELNHTIEKCITKYGARPSFKNYNGFPAASCISPNCIVVHGIPSAKTVLHEGDIVSVDIGACLDGYHGDAARTFPVGNISSEAPFRLLLRKTATALCASLSGTASEKIFTRIPMCRTSEKRVTA